MGVYLPERKTDGSKESLTPYSTIVATSLNSLTELRVFCTTTGQYGKPLATDLIPLSLESVTKGRYTEIFY
jgi:hypothetical protein